MLKPAGGSFKSPPGRIVAVADTSIEDGLKPLAETPRREAAAPPLAVWKCQVAIAVTQASFVLGSVFLKSSLKYVDEEAGEVFSPVVYALAREACAAPILLVLSWIMAGKTSPKRPDLWRVGLMGGAMFLSQLCYILGIELSGVTIATCMQPAIPVFTVLLGIALGMERGNPRKLTGIGLAVVGAICMVAGGAASASRAPGVTEAQADNMLLGDMCLLVNTVAMAVYYILSKQMVSRYPPICVAAWAYLVAASCMGLAAALFTDEADWHFPRSMVLPLIYWIFVCSVAGYYLVTWAMRHLPASQVAAFQCLQPFIGTLLAFLVLNESPTAWDLGAVGIVAGLVMVSTEKKDLDTQAVLARIKRLLTQKSLTLSKSMSNLVNLPGWPSNEQHHG